MSNNNNHIDNWLKESAALGNIAVVNADWIAMQQLLEQKRKRRIIFFWLLAGIISIVLGLLVYYFMQQKKSSSPLNKAENTVTIEKNNVVKDNERIDSDTINTNQKNETVIGSTQNKISKIDNNFDTNKTELNHIDKPQNRNNIANQIQSIKKAVAKAINDPQNNINASQDINIPANASKSPIVKSTIPNATATTQSILNAIDNINNASRKYSPNIIYMHNRYIDSLGYKKTNNTVATIDTTKKQTPINNTTTTPKKKNNTTSLKSYAQINAGYASMNIATSLQTGVVQLQYSFNVAKNIFIDVNAKAFAYKNNDKQKHKNIYRIVPPAGGAAFTEVDIKETEYTIANGFVTEPGVGFHYKIKKLELGAAWHYGMVLNGVNTTTFIYDTFNFFNPLPSNIRLNGEYDANNFIGKKYSTLSFHCTYQLTQKWIADVNYAYLYWYNTIDGVADDNRKRNSFYFTIGYRF